MTHILRSVLLIIAGGIGLLMPEGVWAQACSPQYKQWTQIAGSGVASVPTHDTCFPSASGRSRAYFTQGTQMFTVYNQNYPPGCTPGSGDLCAPTGGTCTRLKGCKFAPLPPWSAPTQAILNGFPNAAPSSSDASKSYAFLVADDGRLYRIDISGDPSGQPPYPTMSVDTRRPSCTFDKLVATPTVQLYARSNAAFKAEVDSHPGHSQDDVVTVVTSTSCGDQIQNRIIAYWASDLTKKWEFNAAGSIPMGGAAEQCALDYVDNRLFCGTEAPPASSQDTLWALNTMNGQLLWSDFPGGDVLASPALNYGRLYVVSRQGVLWAYAPAGNGLGGPSKLWTAGLLVASAGAIVTRSPWVEIRDSTWKDKILVLDSLGTLFAAQDNGANGALLWSLVPSDAAQWVSTPVVFPGSTVSRAFLGRDDGHLQMIKLDDGSVQGIIQIASSTSVDVYDPSIDTDPTTGYAVVVVGGSTVARITIPICPDPPGAAVGLTPTVPAEVHRTTSSEIGNCDDCDSCTVDAFNPAGTNCTHVPVSCDDQDLCTLDDCLPGTGQCAHTPVSCDDGDSCTADSCAPATGTCLQVPIVVTEPTSVQFVSSTSLGWSPTADATHWNVYRGTIPAAMLGSRLPGAVYDQVCHESADALGDGPAASTDGANPPVRSAFYYLVSGEAACESTIGHASSGATIPNVAPCPSPP